MRRICKYPAAIIMAMFLLSACGIEVKETAENQISASAQFTPTDTINSGYSFPVEKSRTALAMGESMRTETDLDKGSNGLTPTPQSNSGRMLSQQETLVNLYKDARKGVVSIRVPTLEGYSLGSGFLLDEQGNILTNYHEIKSQTDVEVVFSSGYSTYWRIHGVDPDADLAIVKVNAPAEELTPLPLGNSDQVMVGQFVVAIGNPFGLEGTMTSGIVSGLGGLPRSFRDTLGESSLKIAEIIQTDALINPGSSGGPLLNLDGEVIGINESIITGKPNHENSGIGFALSINMAKRIAEALIQEGRFVYPYIGISSLDEITLWEQKVLELPSTVGVYVIEVVPDGPAARAGIRGGSEESGIPGVPAGGDLIFGVDGIPVSDFNDLMVYFIRERKPGDTVVLDVLRDSNEIEIELTLGERPVVSIEER